MSEGKRMQESIMSGGSMDCENGMENSVFKVTVVVVTEGKNGREKGK